MIIGPLIYDMSLELDECLTGFDGRCCQFVYHLPIIQGFQNWTIVHLEMVNIFLALRLWSTMVNQKDSHSL